MQIPERVIAQASRTLRVGAMVGDKFDFKGSGFAFVRKHRVLAVTNQHTVRRIHDQYGENASILVWFQEPVRMHPATVLAIDKVNDLAILATGVTADEDDPVEKTGVTIGAKVYVTGYSDEHARQENPVISTGSVVSSGPYIVEKDMFVTSGTYPGPSALAYIISGAVCPSGASGSLVLDESGRMLGYIKGRLDSGECVAIALHKALQIIAGI